MLPLQLFLQPGIVLHLMSRVGRCFNVTVHCQVPISLVYRKDLVKKDGSDPFLLDAYVRFLAAVAQNAAPSGFWTCMLHVVHECSSQFWS